MDPTLRLQPGQQALTPAQEAEAERFAQERIAAQLSTAPVDEPETEQFLRQAYAVAGLPPPPRLQWVDGPLQLVAMLAPLSMQPYAGDALWKHRGASVYASVEGRGRAEVAISVENRVYASVWERVGGLVRASVHANVETSAGHRVESTINDPVGGMVWASVEAYYAAPELAFYRFFDAYFLPNDLHALAHFNERVSGYWLGHERAVIVRRPAVLACDAEGQLHSATGKCLEYRDGWGCYAWHGVRVSERVILAPEQLTREEFLAEPDVEVRWVIQERMGERFVSELGGVVLDSGPRGTLYEVRLPEDDPEGVARYVQVQDASTFRQYFLRVPPTVQTAAEAVAWTFQLSMEDYHPVQEA